MKDNNTTVEISILDKILQTYILKSSYNNNEGELILNIKEQEISNSIFNLIRFITAHKIVKKEQEKKKFLISLTFAIINIFIVYLTYTYVEDSLHYLIILLISIIINCIPIINYIKNKKDKFIDIPTETYNHIIKENNKEITQ